MATYRPQGDEPAFRWVHRALRNFMQRSTEYQRAVIYMAQLINGYFQSPGLNEEAGSDLRVNCRVGEDILTQPTQH